MTKSLQQIVDANPDAETFRFGDSPTVCAENYRPRAGGQENRRLRGGLLLTGRGAMPYPEVGRREISR